MNNTIKVIEDNTDKVLHMERSAINKALKAAGDRAVSDVKEVTPVGTPESTGIKGYKGGTLRRSITKKVEKNSLIVGTNVEYAPYVEFGEKARHKAPTHAHFLRDTIRDNINEYMEIIEDVLTKTI